MIFPAGLTFAKSRGGLSWPGIRLPALSSTEAVYQEVGLSRNESAELVESVIAEISGALERGEMVKISSFGSFAVRQKGQRVGRNPKTGQEVPISPRRVLVFRASHALKDQINDGIAQPVRLVARAAGAAPERRAPEAASAEVSDPASRRRPGRGKAPRRSARSARLPTNSTCRRMCCASGRRSFRSSKPLKRGGGRRYYRPEDIALLRQIRQWLYQDGYTIRGVQQLLESRTPHGAIAGGGPDMTDPVPAAAPDLPSTRIPRAGFRPRSDAETTDRQAAALPGRDRKPGVARSRDPGRARGDSPRIAASPRSPRTFLRQSRTS